VVLVEAVETICSGIDDSETDVVERMAALVDQGLVRQDEGTGGEPRFAMLETIREYALERLEMSGEVGTLRSRHAEYYLMLAESAERKLHGAEQVAWLDQLEREHGNLRAALAWCQTSEVGAAVGVRLVAAVWWFWMVRGHLSEGCAWLAAGLAQTHEPTVARVPALLGYGYLVRIQGDWTLAATLFEESLAVSRVAGDKLSTAYALMNLGSVAGLQSDHRRADGLFEESLALCRELGDTRRLLGWLLIAESSLRRKATTRAQQSGTKKASSTTVRWATNGAFPGRLSAWGRWQPTRATGRGQPYSLRKALR
jgi:non-specific serine/threonine protein kinase